MTKHRPSPSKVEDREQHFERLLAAMGMSEANPFIRFPLGEELKEIERDYAVAVSGKRPDRNLVRRYRELITKLLTLYKTIGPEFFSNEIEKAGWSRGIPDAGDRVLRWVMADHGHERKDVVAVLTEHRLDIDHWLKISGETYKKREVRKLVVEPFLQLMTEHEITTSRKQLPRKRMFDALFDWVGIEKKFRPTSAGINAIARELEGSGSASKSNAKRRTKN
jgi:hypothetical protein